MALTAIKAVTPPATHPAPRAADRRAVAGVASTAPNLNVSHDGALVTADARKPAPEFAYALKMLANPPLFYARESDVVKRAKTRMVEAFDRTVVIDEHGNGYARKAR